MTPTGPAYEHIVEFMSSEAAWLDAYHVAWNVATENGHTGLTPVMSNPPVNTQGSGGYGAGERLTLAFSTLMTFAIGSSVY